MTATGQYDDSFGLPQDKKGPQPAHNGNLGGHMPKLVPPQSSLGSPSNLPDDLQTIIDAWPDLPSEIKIGIIAIIKAVVKE